jgi:hypothetical protein
MGICFSEPTLDELLADSLTQGLMRADGVDAAALRSMLYGLASSIESRPAIQHDRISPNGGSNAGILAWSDPAVLQRGASKLASLQAAAARPSNPCVAC